jgi:hypothetical protein
MARQKMYLIACPKNPDRSEDYYAGEDPKASIHYSLIERFFIATPERARLVQDKNEDLFVYIPAK